MFCFPCNCHSTNFKKVLDLGRVTAASAYNILRSESVARCFQASHVEILEKRMNSGKGDVFGSLWTLVSVAKLTSDSALASDITSKVLVFLEKQSEGSKDAQQAFFLFLAISAAQNLSHILMKNAAMRVEVWSKALKCLSCTDSVAGISLFVYQLMFYFSLFLLYGSSDGSSLDIGESQRRARGVWFGD